MAENLAEIAIRNRNRFIVGWSIGGDEYNFPPEAFEDVYKYVKEAGLHLTAHAGEAAGANSVRNAITLLNCERIGHGIRSIEDSTLLPPIREKQVTLDVALTSNLRTGVITDIRYHPVRKLFDSGVTITINTDDSMFFNTDLTDEYMLLITHFNFTFEEIAKLILNTVKAAFLPEENKDLLRKKLLKGTTRIKNAYGIS